MEDFPPEPSIYDIFSNSKAVAHPRQVERLKLSALLEDVWMCAEMNGGCLMPFLKSFNMQIAV